MAVAEEELLRVYLAEVIPDAGTDDDTLFSNEEIDQFLADGDNIFEAAMLGWQAKAAEFSNLVDVSEGPTKRFLQQRFENAMAMVSHYKDRAGSKGGSTHIRKLTR